MCLCFFVTSYLQASKQHWPVLLVWLCYCLTFLAVAVLCRPGSLPHAAHDPDRAHRELHFRLLRHDVVGPVCDAAQAFAQFGGVSGLKSLKVSSCGPCGALTPPQQLLVTSCLM